MTATPVPAAADSLDDALLDVADLRVSFGTGRCRREVLHGISFRVERGQCVAIVGESGSGKSVTARSLIGLAGHQGITSANRLHLAGRDALRYSERQWRHVRGREVGFVLQDALGSLDPVRTVGHEIDDALRAHNVVPARQRPQRVQELLASVGVPLPQARAAQYPHQLSGGLRQRALIASAIAAEPKLLIADEPTTALDVTVQAQILELLSRKRVEQGLSLLLISHDLSVVSRIADHVLVMKDGLVVEAGPTREVLQKPQHTYTQQLLAAVPAAHPRGTRLSPDIGARPPAPVRTAGDVILEARDLVKRFSLPGHQVLTAVDGVSLTLRSGQTLGIVGESGSGKTTAGRLLLGLQQPDRGTALIDGRPWPELTPEQRRRLRQQIPVIYQDPFSSFDPRYAVERIIAEPLAAAGIPRSQRRDRVLELLAQVGLEADLAKQRPRNLSGGQRQRVAIARALALNPRAILCDEPVSALDVTVQAQILDLLADLQATLGIAYLFISHDLGVVHHISDHVVVMKDGRIVEEADTETVFRHPRHPYTKDLLAAVPNIPGVVPQAQGTASIMK